MKIGISTDGEHSLGLLHPKPTSGHIHVEESLEAAVDSCFLLSPEDRLLDEEDIAARLLDLLADVEDVLSLFSEDTVHLGVV